MKYSVYISRETIYNEEKSKQYDPKHKQWTHWLTKDVLAIGVK